MKNSELINYNPKGLLSNIDKQRQRILQEHSVRQACPNCGAEQNVFEAMGIDIDDYPTNGVNEGPFTCIGCKRALNVIVPLFHAGGPYWRWELVPEPSLRQGVPRGTGAPSSPRPAPPASNE